MYSAGNRVEPRAAYRAFRGRDAAVEPMLAKRGLAGGSRAGLGRERLFRNARSRSAPCSSRVSDAAKHQRR